MHSYQHLVQFCPHFPRKFHSIVAFFSIAIIAIFYLTFWIREPKNQFQSIIVLAREWLELTELTTNMSCFRKIQKNVERFLQISKNFLRTNKQFMKAALPNEFYGQISNDSKKVCLIFLMGWKFYFGDLWESSRKFLSDITIYRMFKSLFKDYSDILMQETIFPTFRKKLLIRFP